MTSALGLALLAAATAPIAGTVLVDGAGVRANAVIDATVRARLPKATTNAAEHDGSFHDYSGIRLADALSDAGVPTGDKVRGPLAQTYVLVTASDGYTAVFALAELDTAETRCAPLLVDKRDGAPLGPSQGPVGIVSPCDRTHARWVRGVTKLTVTQAAPPKPY